MLPFLAFRCYFPSDAPCSITLSQEMSGSEELFRLISRLPNWAANRTVRDCSTVTMVSTALIKTFADVLPLTLRGKARLGSDSMLTLWHSYITVMNPQRKFHWLWDVPVHLNSSVQSDECLSSQGREVGPVDVSWPRRGQVFTNPWTVDIWQVYLWLLFGPRVFNTLL